MSKSFTPICIIWVSRKQNIGEFIVEIQCFYKGVRLHTIMHARGEAQADKLTDCNRNPVLSPMATKYARLIWMFSNDISDFITHMSIHI